MKERPILFSDPMVKAILNGRKTMTRRVIKHDVPFATSTYFDEETSRWYWDMKCGVADPCLGKCPYGQPGDRLWVRETWRVGSWREDDGQIAVDFKADGFPHQKWRTVPDPDKFNDLWEESTQEAEKVYGMKERYGWKPGKSPCRWRPSIFMPRWAARIILEITAIRVERLGDITIEDAQAEGVTPLGVEGDGRRWRAAFRELWDSLNAKRGYGWDANPWVWVIEFRRL